MNEVTLAKWKADRKAKKLLEERRKVFFLPPEGFLRVPCELLKRICSTLVLFYWFVDVVVAFVVVVVVPDHAVVVLF